MKILIMDDHLLFVEGMHHILGSLINNLTLLNACCAKDGLSMAAHHGDFELVLLDLDLPDVSGLKVLEQFKQNLPLLPIIILSDSDNQADMCQAMNSGAAGYVHKASKSSVLLNVIKLVLAGGIYIPPALLKTLSTFVNKTAAAQNKTQTNIEYKPDFSEIYPKLTSRQSEILNHITDGLSNKEMAQSMNIAESTAKAHVAAVLKVLNVPNRTKAAQAVYKSRLIIAR